MPADACACGCPAELLDHDDDGDKDAGSSATTTPQRVLRALAHTGLGRVDAGWLSRDVLGVADTSFVALSDALCHVGHAGEISRPPRCTSGQPLH